MKATVDAYDGTVNFYVVDPKDPIIKTYRKAFPELFSDFSQMDKIPGPARAPALPGGPLQVPDRACTAVPHHEPVQFFNRQAIWEVVGRPRERAAPTNDVSTSRTRRRTRRRRASGSNRSTCSRGCPGQTKEEFLILRPFVPVSKGNSQNRLASFMVAHRADPTGTALESLEMPTGLTVAGPVQVYRTINNTAAISKEFSLLNQQGSRVIQGSIQIIPVKDSLLYVQPVYVLSENGQQPAFRDVIVYYNGTAAIDKTLTGALSQFPAFSGIAPPPDTGNADAAPPTGGTGTDTSTTSSRRRARPDEGGAGRPRRRTSPRTSRRWRKLSDVLAQVIDARAEETGKAAGSTTSSS